MRATLRLALLAAALAGLLAAGARAEPTPGPGYRIEVLRKSGAIFCGVTQDGPFLLLTDLADGRLYRLDFEGRFTAFGPTLPHGLDVIGDPTGPYRAARAGKGYLVAQGWTPA